MKHGDSASLGALRGVEGDVRVGRDPMGRIRAL